MDRRQEVEARLSRVRGLLEERGLSGALFATPGGFAWIVIGAGVARLAREAIGPELDLDSPADAFARRGPDALGHTAGRKRFRA